MSTGQDFASPLHPHEPEIPPSLDLEGRCLVCGLLAERDRYRDLLGRALDTMGVSHTVVDGPNARWIDVPGEDVGYFDEDLVPSPDCAVCAVEREIREALSSLPVATEEER